MYALQASSQAPAWSRNIRTALSSAGVGGGPVPSQDLLMAPC